MNEKSICKRWGHRFHDEDKGDAVVGICTKCGFKKIWSRQNPAQDFDHKEYNYDHRRDFIQAASDPKAYIYCNIDRPGVRKLIEQDKASDDDFKTKKALDESERMHREWEAKQVDLHERVNHGNEKIGETTVDF